jgi:putative endonuclease
MATHRMTVGRIGEDLAADFLIRRGAAIVGRNVRVGRDEIDLIVELDGRRVAVEVKAALGAVAPEEHFDAAKEANLRRAVRQLEPPIARIDLVTVVLDGDGATVRWIPDAG